MARTNRRVFVIRADRARDDDPDSDGNDRGIPVDDAAAMQALAAPLRVRLLRLLDEPATASDLAEAVGRPVTSIYHHLDRLEEAGLIDVAELRKEGRATVRRYRRTTDLVGEPARTVQVRMTVDLGSEEVDGLVAGVRAFVESYTNKAKRGRAGSKTRLEIVFLATERADLGEDDE